jgi:spermidine synthase
MESINYIKELLVLNECGWVSAQETVNIWMQEQEGCTDVLQRLFGTNMYVFYVLGEQSNIWRFILVYIVHSGKYC